MKKYEIPVTWMMRGSLNIEADSLAEAIKKAHDEPLPNGEYIDGSFEIDNDYLSELYPGVVQS